MHNYFSEKNVCADLYFGTGAGKHLEKAIDQAKKEIYIVSPYLNSGLVSRLVRKAENGVHVTLITTDVRKNKDGTVGHREIVPQILLQERQTKENALLKIKKWRRFKNIWSIFSLVVLLILLTFFLLNLGTNITIRFEPISLSVFLILGLALFLYLPIKKAKGIIESISIYTYRYSPKPNIDFRLFQNQTEDKGNIHAKIYCIDHTTYLGSLNFTKSGFYTSYETFICIKDNETTQKIKNDIQALYSDSDRLFYTYQYLGSSHFIEPRK